jgi:CRP-like cAMP-binding protein
MAAEPAIPPPLDDDDDDVAWALQTAAVQWNRGARGDAVVWLRRAVDAAIACGNAQRTKDLTRLAATVADSLVAQAMAQPDSAAPPPPSSPEREAGPKITEIDRASPNPRHSLTGEIPFEVEGESGAPSTEEASLVPSTEESSLAPSTEEDDFDDEAPTIPPPPKLETFRAGGVGTHSSGEYSVDADDLLPESMPASGRVPWDVEGGVEESPFNEPTMASQEHAEVPSSESPTIERVVPDLFAPLPDESAPLVPSGAGASHEASPVSSDVGGVAPAEAKPLAHAEPTLVAAKSPEVPPVDETPAESSIVDGVALEGVRGFEDLPEDAQYKLAASAVVSELGVDEEVLSFAAALVTNGRVGIMPAIADVAAGLAQPGDIVFTRGTLEEGVLLRVVALQAGTRVATWSTEALTQALSDCPWVEDELRLVADRFQALAGSVLGPLGDRLDDSLRGLVMPKLEVRAYGPGEVIVEQGSPVPGLHVIGAGRLEIVEANAVTGELTPGDFLFAEEVLASGKAHATARAGQSGALLLVASRAVAHELLVSVPPLLEILAG